MFKLRPIGKMTKCFLPTGGTDRIDLCMTGIEVYPHSSPVSHLGQSNILKSVLYIEKSAVGHQIILNRIVRN